MKARQKVTSVAMLALLAAAATGFYLSSGSAPSISPGKTSPQSTSETPSINQNYLDVALRLAVLAATPEEQRAARATLDAADHELDLEYAYALQLVAIEPVPETPQIRAIRDRIAKIEAILQTRRTEMGQLQRAMAQARGSRRNSLEEQLDISQAEFNLSKEMLADAHDELIQTGGDPRSRLQQLKEEHEAASKADDTFKFPPLPGPAHAGSLLAKWSHWKSVHQMRSQIRQAQEDAQDAAARLTQQREALKKQVATEQEQRKALASHQLTPEQIAALVASPGARPIPLKTPASPTSANPSPVAQASENAPSPVNPALLLIQRISAHHAMLRILGGRIRAMNELASAYKGWGSLVEAAARRILHGILVGGLWIILLMVFAFFLNRLIEHFLVRLSLERKQRTTLQSVFRMTVQLAVALVILLIIFGKPNQLSTVLGLAGAGLAIALQDVILSFLGWFVLMGRYGIRVGDWVEINPNAFTGVRGEVVEITLFRTVLLETGNWNEPSHPTGRQVAFMNMYAVTGYYFNFTTSGQWLWDELEVLIPASQNPSPLLEKIRAIVTEKTASQAELAEGEWQTVSRRYGMKSLSAKPSVNLKLTDNGVMAIVRYITRADERTETRHRMNHEIVKLIHNGEDIVPATQVLPAPAEPH